MRSIPGIITGYCSQFNLFFFMYVSFFWSASSCNCARQIPHDIVFRDGFCVFEDDFDHLKFLNDGAVANVWIAKRVGNKNLDRRRVNSKSINIAVTKICQMRVHRRIARLHFGRRQKNVTRCMSWRQECTSSKTRVSQCSRSNSWSDTSLWRSGVCRSLT